MGRSTSNADAYRRNADECIEWAKTAKSDFERNTFLQMAQTWLAAAVYADSQSRGRRSDAGRSRAHASRPRDPPEDRPQ
jgi:hypothetical protein